MHRRRRTALAVTAATLLAAPLLSACGSEAHPGAAAVVGGDRIEMSAIQAQVADVRGAQEESGQSGKLVKESGQLTRAKLHSTVFARVLDRASEDAGVSVSRKEIQQARSATAAQAGGDEGMRTAMLEQFWLAPDQIEQDLRTRIQLQKLALALGADVQSPEGQQTVTKALTDASKALDIDINPRYGAWDDQKVQLSTYASPWIKQVTRSPQQGPETGA